MSGRMTSKALKLGSLLFVLSGVLVGTTAAGAEDCVHPFPCEEGAGPQGPFALREVRYERLEVPQDWDKPDGPTIELEGWIGLPDVPGGTRVPVALHSTPYMGDCSVALLITECDPTPDDESWWAETAHPWAQTAWGVPPIELVRRGFAAAFFSVRGSGTSGGCVNWFGRQEQRDQAFLVESLGGRSWSNGRVGMGGVSYPAATAWEAAVLHPSALKTIVTAGIVSDAYLLTSSPQGALRTIGIPFPTMFTTAVSMTPAANNKRAVEYLPGHGARVCPDVVEFLSTSNQPVVDDRNEAFYDERRLIDRFESVTAAVLLTQGFADISGHGFQDGEAWHALANAPKRSIIGRWGHTLPSAPGALDRPWADVLFPWLDYWLNGVGSVPEGLGSVDYRDTSSKWRTSAAWPPVEAREEVLFLAGSELGKQLSGASRTFRSAPHPTNNYRAAGPDWPSGYWPALCAPGATDSLGLAYISEPLPEDAVLAGNPFALLRLSSDQPGGIVGVHVLSLDEGFDCTDPGHLDLITFGMADLRFHAGNLAGRPFPVNEPAPVRVDLWDNAAHISKGSRLAVVVSYGEGGTEDGAVGQPYYPNVTVLSDGDLYASQVVLPIVEGTFGGEQPTIQYPPRPFVPVD